MITQIVAKRYAKALLAIGREDNNFEKYGEDLAVFAQLMARRDLAEALTNPIYPYANRKQILDAILEKISLSQAVINFLRLLMDKGRINLVESISDYYQRLVDEVNNIERATIVAATSLPESIHEQVKQILEEMTGKSILLEVEQDPEIIGGIVAQVGDLTLDGSVKTQLKNLKESLIKG
ncbi:MAG: F0F1 ATP synthase subunit delta [Deltaproteobacteria bacterium]|nr:F0F1 ATP synthase subunit delta [Deltaproteobacteria bacterium]